MAKQIKAYTVEISKTGAEDPVGTIRYTVNDTVETDLNKYGELAQVITGTDTVAELLTGVEDAIKTAEGIS